MKKFALVLVAVVGVLMMNSCSILGIGQGVTLYNYSSYSIMYVYMSDDYLSSGWGSELLGISTTIPSGSVYNFATFYSQVDLYAESSAYWYRLVDIPTAGPTFTPVYITDSKIYRETEDGTVVTVAVKPTGNQATQTTKLADHEPGVTTK